MFFILKLAEASGKIILVDPYALCIDRNKQCLELKAFETLRTNHRHGNQERQ